MSKAKQASSFDLAVEQARLDYLASSEHVMDTGKYVGVKTVITAILEEQANRRKPRVYSSPNVVKETGKFYDLEFCLWLQHNFDYLLRFYGENPDFPLYQGASE